MTDPPNSSSKSLVRIVLCAMLLPAVAAAEPFAATSDLSLKIGEGKQSDSGEDRSLFMSLIIGGTYAVQSWLDVSLDLSATKATADWEQVSGLSNAALSASAHERDGIRWRAGLGVTLPLATIGTIEDFPMNFEGDSLVYSATTDDQDTWDYSAYRRAAMNRGDWNMWMWAPDWVTVFAPARVETDVNDAIVIAADGAIGTAFAIGDGHDSGDVAVVVQGAIDAAWRANQRSRLGLRVLDVIVFYDDLSPHLTSVEPYLGYRSGATDLRIRLTLPVKDHRHADAMSGRSGFRAYEEWGINTSLAYAF